MSNSPRKRIHRFLVNKILSASQFCYILCAPIIYGSHDRDVFRAFRASMQDKTIKRAVRYALPEDDSVRGKNRLSKPIFERSTSVSGIERTHDCKRPKQRDGCRQIAYPAKRKRVLDCMDPLKARKIDQRTVPLIAPDCP